MMPAVLVMPDTFTSLGGNQFIDSEIMGNWGEWLQTDLRNQIQERYDVSGFVGWKIKWRLWFPC